MEKSRTVYAMAPGVTATADLVIKDFLDVMKISKPGKCYASDTFMVGDTPMVIEVYPNGHVDERKGFVSVFLDNKSDAKITVKYQFITEAKTWNSEREMKAKRCWGLPNFLSHAKCTEAYDDEKDFVLTAKVEIYGDEAVKIMGNEDTAVPKKYCVALCKNLFEKMMDSNFSLVFQGAEVPCHRQVLAAASPSLRRW